MRKKLIILTMIFILALAISCNASVNNSEEFIKNKDNIEFDGQTYPKLAVGDGKVRLLSHWGQIDLGNHLNNIKKIYGIDIELVYEKYNNFAQRVESMQKSGERLDVVLFSNDQYPISFAKDLYLPLDDYINFGNEIWAPAKKASDKMRYNGRMYMVADYSVRRFIWYNEKLFRDNQLESPMDLYEKNQWTWEILAEYAKKIAKDADGDGDFETLGIMGNAGIFGGLFASKNTNFKILTPEGIRNTCLDNDTANIMNFGYELFKQQGFKNTEELGPEYFLNGQCGMLCDGYYVIFSDKRYQDFAKTGDLSFVPMPRWENQAEAIYFTEFSGYMIPKNVGNMDSAIAFLTYYRVNENNKKSIIDSYNQLKSYDLPKKSLDLYYKINTSKTVMSVPSCVLTDNLIDEFRPFTWLLDEKHNWSFIKLRTNSLFNQQINTFNSKYANLQ